jgi:uncharacterized protein (DUF1800 family)
MWTADEFYSTRAKSRTVKNPVDFAVQAMRAFDVSSTGRTYGTSDRQLGEQLALMNMRLFDPPSVGGRAASAGSMSGRSWRGSSWPRTSPRTAPRRASFYPR